MFLVANWSTHCIPQLTMEYRKQHDIDRSGARSPNPSMRQQQYCPSSFAEQRTFYFVFLSQKSQYLKNMDSPLHVANRTTTSSNRKRKSMDNSAGNVISQGKSQQKENADIGAEKRAKLPGKAYFVKEVGVRSNTTMGEAQHLPLRRGSSPGYQNHRQSPAARGKWGSSLQTQATNVTKPHKIFVRLRC